MDCVERIAQRGVPTSCMVMLQFMREAAASTVSVAELAEFVKQGLFISKMIFFFFFLIIDD